MWMKLICIWHKKGFSMVNFIFLNIQPPPPLSLIFQLLSCHIFCEEKKKMKNIKISMRLCLRYFHKEPFEVRHAWPNTIKIFSCYIIFINK